MGFNTDSSTPNTTEKTKQIKAAIAYLRQNRNAQAFLLLSEPGLEKDPAAEFALGLCYLRADELTSAVSHFEQALWLIKSAGFSPRAESGNAVYLKLAAGQIADEVYLTPMDASYCTLFPKAAEQTVMLAMIHTYRLMGMSDQARRVAAGLTGPEFDEFKKK